MGAGNTCSVIFNVLDRFSCSFEGGKLSCIVGPSGCGKTTLLSIIAGLDRPGSGEVYIDDMPLSSLDLDNYRRQKVSMIFQMFNLFPLLTAIENVSYPLEINGVDAKQAKERAAELLASVNIDRDKYSRYPSQLSGGEQQRVAIARALSNQSGVILADEPTGNLDPDNSDKIMEILLDLAHDKGYCVIVVTHDPKVADMADVVFTMSGGSLSVENQS